MDACPKCGSALFEDDNRDYAGDTPDRFCVCGYRVEVNRERGKAMWAADQARNEGRAHPRPPTHQGVRLA